MKELCDLHIHMGSSVAPHVMWSIAHQQGLRLPFRGYHEFVDAITINPEREKTLDDYLNILHTWTERIQSSPLAVERAVYEILGKEFRSSHVKRIELRFNPMKRNVGGERDLDHIIHAAIRGLDQACLEYGIEAGLIFCLAREFPADQNEIILDKAIKYRSRGVIGIDIAGTESKTIERSTASLNRYVQIFNRAKKAGLGTTIHTGETKSTNGEGVLAVAEYLKPDRIGHGIRAAYSETAMRALVKEGIVLEICPTSNLHTRAVSDLEELRYILGQFDAFGVQYTINTDGTYLCSTNLAREFEILENAGILTGAQQETVRQLAFQSSFLER